ncbi:MAG TPA: hypothetical protein VNS32_22960, partial [Flavisolibacter sp.]|nr:hypothetical protein [Flavisolibacter sp.]
TFSYLTAYQASLHGLDKVIKNDANSKPIGRFDGVVKKSHHISEVTVTDEGGNRSVYGIPVYNKTQQEITFSIDPPADLVKARKTGIINYTTNNLLQDHIDHSYGRDNLYSCTTTPGYATSFLLTAILSPDYVDRTGDGVTDDDLGTSVKFNYSKLSNDFKWRAPYGSHTANFNEGFINDRKDDKGSIVYGEKEVWYLHSIESKTMIAIFETIKREDALGVKDVNGEMDAGNQLLKLDRIKLYSKEDWLKNGNNAVPIKVVNFEYDYSLYPGVPNNSGKAVDISGNPTTDNNANVNLYKGKLTLTKVYFTFGTSSRGQSNPYVFSYDKRPVGTVSNLPANPDEPTGDDPMNNSFIGHYGTRETDRWGTYKQSFYNHQVGNTNVLNNSEFPYAPQEDASTPYSEKELADRFASKWQLNEIVTPSGSKISVNYESDDYGYVQNKRAMQMCFVADDPNKDLIHATKLKVHLPKPEANYSDFIKDYLQQADGSIMNKLYFKLMTNLDNKKLWEFVSGYAEIDVDAFNSLSISDGGYSVEIPIKQINGYSPFSKAGWQILISDLPQYAYDNYDNS